MVLNPLVVVPRHRPLALLRVIAALPLAVPDGSTGRRRQRWLANAGVGVPVWWRVLAGRASQDRNRVVASTPKPAPPAARA